MLLTMMRWWCYRRWCDDDDDNDDVDDDEDDDVDDNDEDDDEEVDNDGDDDNGLSSYGIDGEGDDKDDGGNNEDDDDITPYIAILRFQLPGKETHNNHKNESFPSPLHGGDVNIDLPIGIGERLQINVTLTPTHLGREERLLLFDFGDFQIGRRVVVDVKPPETHVYYHKMSSVQPFHKRRREDLEEVSTWGWKCTRCGALSEELRDGRLRLFGPVVAFSVESSLIPLPWEKGAALNCFNVNEI